MSLKVDDVYQKARNQLAKKMRIENHAAAMAVADATGIGFKNRMLHFMSLGLPAIEQYVFSNQTPRQIFSDWTPIEDAWKAKRLETVPIDREGVDTLIEYPDGSEWVNLNTSYCKAEGDAMGHCGNAGSVSDDDTVLSYRTIEDIDGEKMWKPRLTFILNKKTGLLGETKGRANQPPAEKYHGVIVDLLKHDFVKGIRGGGYLPENNFKLTDLPEELQEELVEEKPGLASIAYDYKKRGMTKELLSRMEAMWEGTEQEFPRYHEDTFLHNTGNTIHEFIINYGGDQAEYVSNILSGNEHLDIWFDGAPTDDLWVEIPTKIQQEVGKWLIENHNDEVEEWKEDNDTDYDGTDASDTWSIMNDHGIEEVEDAMNRGMMTGYQYGAENEMHKDLKSWLEELPNERDWDLGLTPGWGGDEDTTQLLGTTVDVMIDMIDNWIDDLQYHGDVAGLAEIKKMEAPYNGWEGYDEEAAIEYAIEQLYEEGVISR